VDLVPEAPALKRREQSHDQTISSLAPTLFSGTLSGYCPHTRPNMLIPRGLSLLVLVRRCESTARNYRRQLGKRVAATRFEGVADL
jgi:hypothetical protein